MIKLPAPRTRPGRRKKVTISESEETRNAQLSEPVVKDDVDFRRVVVRPVRRAEVSRWRALMARFHYLGMGYPFNRSSCRLPGWITLALARTIRGPSASSKPGSGPMPTACSGCDGPPASLARAAATMEAGGSAMAGSCAPGAVSVPR